MRFIGAVVAWLFASLLTYVLAISAAQLQAAFALSADGAPMPAGALLGFLGRSLAGGVSYLGIVLIGFAIAFYVAKVVKTLVPVLSPIAYPVAGGVALWVAYSLMVMRFGLFPIRGANLDFGLIYQIAAGALGGLAFNIFRPRRD